MVDPQQQTLVTRALVAAAEALDRRVGWFRLPTPLGLAVLVGLRSRLRSRNLFDTGPHPAGPLPPDVTGEHQRARTVDGTYNSPDDPRAGSIGCRFGRNFPLDHTYPEGPTRIMEPNPRTVSRQLLTRERFQPATTLNLLAAAWIQFEVHDWFVPRACRTRPLHRHPGRRRSVACRPDDHPANGESGRPRSGRPADLRQPARPTGGTPPRSTAAPQNSSGDPLRIGQARQARDRRTGLLRLDPDAAGQSGGGRRLVGRPGAAAHAVHARTQRDLRPAAAALPRHGRRRSSSTRRDWSIAALIAKIHTVEWTPAIIAHPTTVDRACAPTGSASPGSGYRRRFGDSAATKCSAASRVPRVTTSGVPYSITEEFVAVYRMHPLIPDELVVRSLGDDTVLAEHAASSNSASPTSAQRAAPRRRCDDLLYSFGRANPGALTLHNYPVHCSSSSAPRRPLIDLAAVDILRVPRARSAALQRVPPPTAAAAESPRSTSSPTIRGGRANSKRVYGGVDDVDLMIGLYAEPKPPGFGFSDTAFRIFVLMASRRL